MSLLLRPRRALLPFLCVASLALAACSSTEGGASAGAHGAREDDALRPWLERIYAKGEFKARSFGPVRWLADGKAYTTVESGQGGNKLVRYEAASGARTVLVSSEQLTPPGGHALALEDYAWSGDETRLLVFTNSQRVWRQNTRGDYWVLELASGKLAKLGGDAPESSLMFAKFSPDGTRVGYVCERDLWVETLADGTRTRLTSDGSPTIVSGTSDWVYEEELEVRDAWRWSPDGARIAFWRFDQSGLGEFTLVNDTDTLYPVVQVLPYPKAGTTNSAVALGIVPAAGGAPVWAALPGDARENYVARVLWTGPDELLVQQLERRQKKLEVFAVDARTGGARSFFVERDEGWVDVVDDWQLLPGEKELLWVSDRDGWRRAWAIGRDGTARAITPEKMDLTAVVGLDAAGKSLYFQASPDDPTRRFLYRVALSGGAAERVTPAAETGTHTYALAPAGDLALHTSSGFDHPPRVELVRLPGHESVRALEENAELAARLSELAPAPAEFFQLEIEPGVRLDAWLLYPPGFQRSKSYPLVQFTYAEPSAVQATDEWKSSRILFNRALTHAGYVVACVDSRGSPAPRGRAWRKRTAGNPGVMSAADQAAAARALLATRPYLDPERVAVWGWSGGGTMTLNLLFRSPELYGTGCAVAPVPDMTLYDSVYQERYLGLPQENADAYRANSPLSAAEGLRGNLLVVHGTGDDNVHFQGTERLINRLVELGKPFELMVYPNRTHAIAEGKGTQLHVFSLLGRFLTEHCPPGPR